MKAPIHTNVFLFENAYMSVSLGLLLMLICWAFSLIMHPFEKCRLRAVSLFSVVRLAKRETREWPRARLMARDGRGTRPRFARLAASPLARACALPLLNRKKKRDCSQSRKMHLRSGAKRIHIYIVWVWMVENSQKCIKMKSMTRKYHRHVSL